MRKQELELDHKGRESIAQEAGQLQAADQGKGDQRQDKTVA